MFVRRDRGAWDRRSNRRELRLLRKLRRRLPAPRDFVRIRWARETEERERFRRSDKFGRVEDARTSSGVGLVRRSCGDGGWRNDSRSDFGGVGACFGTGRSSAWSRFGTRIPAPLRSLRRVFPRVSKRRVKTDRRRRRTRATRDADVERRLVGLRAVVRELRTRLPDRRDSSVDDS